MRRKDDVLITQFAECADMILAGASVAACLERFPDHAAQLEPMLLSISSARQGRAIPLRPADVAERSRAVFMEAAVRTQHNRRAAATAIAAIPPWQKIFTIFQPRPYGAPSTRPVALFAILLILFISGIVISGSVTLAANALPGDPLYGVKTATEDVRLFLTPAEEMKTQLRREFGQRRIDEAQAVVEHRRPVDNLRLQGTIESFDAHQWMVSGLRVTLDASSQVEGTPVVGATVDGRVRAPGDGRLVLIFAEIQPPPPNQQVQRLTIEPNASAAPAATATATFTPADTASPEPSPAETHDGGVLPGQTPAEPTDEPTREPTPTPTRTVSPARTPTRTPTPTLTPTVTLTPTPTWTLRPPRPTDAPVRISGRLMSISGNVWTIGGQPVEVTGATQIVGDAVLGSSVDCEAWERPGAIPLAFRITVTAPPDKPPELFEFQEVIEAIDPPWWTIGGFRVKEVEGTSVSPGIEKGDLVSVRALKQANDELWAIRISKVEVPTVQIDGIIEAISSSSITIDGISMTVTSATQFVGSPAVGRMAQARALQYPDGSLIAQVVVVLDSPTETPTPEPTSTPTSGPTAAPVLEPTASPLESPTGTT